MKKLVSTISPYLLLLIPVFIAIMVLLFNSENDILKQELELHAAFVKIPQINVFEVIVSFFRSL